MTLPRMYMLVAFVNVLMSFIFLALVVSSAHAKNLLVWRNIDHPYASFLTALMPFICSQVLVS